MHPVAVIDYASVHVSPNFHLEVVVFLINSKPGSGRGGGERERAHKLKIDVGGYKGRPLGVQYVIP